MIIGILLLKKLIYFKNFKFSKNPNGEKYFSHKSLFDFCIDNKFSLFLL